MTDDQRILSIAAASSRVGYVVLKGMAYEGSGLSRKASSGPDAAAACAAQWIEEIRPDVVITEKVLAKSKKGARTRDVIAAMTGVADVADVLNIEIARWQGFESKYAEARALALEFPAMAHLVPRTRRPWESEPKATVYFEALSLALAAFGGPGSPHGKNT